MTDKQAMAQAKKRWGKNGFIESRLGAQDADGREKARTEMLQLKEEKTNLEAELQRRLAETGWYREIQEKLRQLSTARQKALGRAHSYRFRVGEIHNVGGLGMAHIRGEGDTWEEAFAKAGK